MDCQQSNVTVISEQPMGNCSPVVLLLFVYVAIVLMFHSRVFQLIDRNHSCSSDDRQRDGELSERS